MYGPVPPVGVTCALPSLRPQVAVALVEVVVIGGGCVMVAVRVTVHPLESVIVTV